MYIMSTIVINTSTRIRCSTNIIASMPSMSSRDISDNILIPKSKPSAYLTGRNVSYPSSRLLFGDEQGQRVDEIHRLLCLSCGLEDHYLVVF